MTCRSQLLAARRHAELVEAAETCAPTVSAPYLAAAIERCKLPISVSMVHSERLGIDRFHVRATDTSKFGDFDPVSAVTPTADFATSFYFKLVATLLEPAPILPAETHGSGAQTAGASAPASLSESAGACGQHASPPVGAVSSDAVAGALPPRASAEIPACAVPVPVVRA